jgi:membrane associated rhomboid family serine protease
MYRKDYRRKSENNSSPGIFSSFSVTAWIIILNIFFFVVVSIFGFILGEKVYDYIAIYPAHIITGKYLWTLITHMFMHGNIFHLFINMFVLFSLGGLCEKIIGRKRYFWFYIVSGVFAGLLSAMLAGFYGYGFFAKIFGAPNIYMVGASGAIFAVAGLFVVLLPKIRFSIIFLPFFSLPGYIMVPLILFITWLASVAGDLPIGNVAHFGGFFSGLVYGLYLRSKYKRKVKLLQKMFR